MSTPAGGSSRLFFLEPSFHPASFPKIFALCGLPKAHPETGVGSRQLLNTLSDKSQRLHFSQGEQIRRLTGAV